MSAPWAGASWPRYSSEYYQGDSMSYLQQDPDWKPTLGQDQDFKMADDLLRFAGVA